MSDKLKDAVWHSFEWLNEKIEEAQEGED